MLSLPDITGHWGDFFGATNNAVQTLAIVVGGGWAYRKYVHNLANYASLLLDVEASLQEVQQRKTMRIATKITNSGTYHMDFNIACQQYIAVRCLDRRIWKTKCTTARIDWAEGERIGFDQLVDGRGVRDVTMALEPSESISHSWLVPLPHGDWVAYRVVFKVDACRRAWGRPSKPMRWTTTKIVVGAG